MTIYDKNGEPFLEVTPDDTSCRHREVMGDDALTLKFSSPVHVESPVGAWCEFGGETVIHLYERENYPAIYTAPTSTTNCYQNRTNLSDYDAIPSGWK